MALYFRNRVTGREATVLEPKELGEKLKTVTRRGKPLDKDRIIVAESHRKQLLDKMAESWKWERIERPSKAKSTGEGKGGQKSGEGKGGQKFGEGKGGQKSGEGNGGSQSSEGGQE